MIFTATFNVQIQYGQLKSCFNSDDGTFCVVQLLYRDIERNGQQEYSKQDCPILKMSTHLLTVRSGLIICPVSVVHHCASSCRLVKRRKRTLIEREDIELSGLTVCHNYKNNTKFVLNVYCTSNLCF